MLAVRKMLRLCDMMAVVTIQTNPFRDVVDKFIQTMYLYHTNNVFIQIYINNVRCNKSVSLRLSPLELNVRYHSSAWESSVTLCPKSTTGMSRCHAVTLSRCHAVTPCIQCRIPVRCQQTDRHPSQFCIIQNEDRPTTKSSHHIIIVVNIYDDATSSSKNDAAESV
jgi:hypothetical protein